MKMKERMLKYASLLILIVHFQHQQIRCRYGSDGLSDDKLFTGAVGNK